MRQVELTKQFKKQFKLAQRDPRKDTEKLHAVVNQLQEHGTLPTELKPHPLSGCWRPAWSTACTGRKQTNSD
jgi:addiction module RelE/StbE family toxin